MEHQLLGRDEVGAYRHHSVTGLEAVNESEFAACVAGKSHEEGTDVPRARRLRKPASRVREDMDGL